MCSKKEDLEKIADCKQSGTFQAWKYNEGKTFDWLGKKVSRLTQHLKDKNFNVTQSAVSSNYVKTDSATVPESNCLERLYFSLRPLMISLIIKVYLHDTHSD